jgi:PAS domain S-box-containing protein
VNKLRLLLLEDNPLDAELILANLAEGGIECAPTRVQTRAEFLAALGREAFDLILADYTLPAFDGLAALQIAQEVCPEVPFLIVSGAVGEERAIETLKRGATDYVLKQRLERLTPAVRRALREARERAERRRAEQALRESEERFRLLVNGVKDYAIVFLDQAGQVISWNEGAQRTLGYSSEEILGQQFARFYSPDDSRYGGPQRALRQAAARGEAHEDTWLIRKDGSRFFASGVTVALRDESGQPRGFATILRDLTDRKRLEETLRQRAEDLAEADRRKDEFLAMLAHELRNPLAPVRTALQILWLRCPPDPALRQVRDIMERQVRNLVRLVDDLLDMSRVSRGKMELRKERVDLASVIQLAVETALPLIDNRRHQLTVTTPEEPLWLDADPVRLGQILSNLLNNAAKYTDPGGHIWLTARRAGGETVVSVRDTGIGIAPELRGRIFDLFMQAHHTPERAQGGMGIGLSLVHRLVELHGGTIEVASEGPGRGSEFTVQLPLAASAPAERGPANVAPAPAPAVPAQPKRVLVVDDNRDGAESLAMLLGIWGHEVELAGDGGEALAAVCNRRPDVVLLDIGLPGMDGYQVAQRLRQLPGMGGTVLVALTGCGQDDDRRRAREAGFDAHMVKPVDPDQLERLLVMAKRGNGVVGPVE